MLRHASAVLFLLGAAVAQSAAPPSPDQRVPPVLSGAKASDLERQVDRMFRGCSRPGSPGAVVLVARDQRVLLQKAYGLADLERNVPLTVDSVLDIGSTSKQFTATCLLLAEQDGKLDLADEVREYVDELPACCNGVTLRHLMLHTSGVPDYIGLMLAGGAAVEDRTSNDDALAALAGIDRLDFAVGSQWQYSNSNYLLISQVVERATGLPLPEFAQTRIFDVLGMQNTHVHRDCTTLVPNRALSYSRGNGGWRWNFSNWEQTGDGAVFTTVGDLLTWARNFEHGRLGGQQLLDRMSRPGHLDDGGEIAYGTGLIFERLGEHGVVSHGGAWAAYRAELLRIPALGITVVCLCNRDDINPSRLARRIARLLVDADEARAGR